VRLESFAIRGLGPFVDATVDFAQLPEGARVVAVVGENGAGKTTALELALLGAPYRELPTRGSIVGLATQRGASVESVLGIGHGRRVRIRQTVDPVSGGGETSITDASTGAALTSSTKVTEADAWVKAHMPAREVVTSSLFAVQGSAGFLAMKPAERKRVLLRVHGIERIERLAEQARERAGVAKLRRAAGVAARDEAARAVPAVEPGSLLAAVAEVTQLEGDLVSARAATQAARAGLAEAQAAASAQRAVEASRERAARTLAERSKACADIAARLRRNAELLEQEPTIHAALAALEVARGAAADAKSTLDASLTAWKAAEQAARQAAETVRDYERRVTVAERQYADACARRTRHRDALAHAEGLVLLESGIRDVEARAEGAERTLAELQSAQAGRSATRIVNLRAGFGEIVNTASNSDPYGVASEALAEDDAQAAREVSYPADVAAAQHALRGARAELARARTARDEVARLAAGLDPGAEDAVRQDGERLDDLRGELAAVRLRHELRQDEAAEARTGLAKAEQAWLARSAEADEATNALRAWPGNVAQLLDQARARVEELQPQLEAAERLRAETAAELAALPSPEPVDVVGPSAALAEALRVETTAEPRLRDAVEREARLRARIEESERAITRLLTLDAELTMLDRELARWSRLATDLGKDGVQALLIDAAGPALTALVNELLHACVSTRWTVTIATTRLTKSGEDREALEVRVLDTLAGREGPVESFSGGECVLLGEAVALALTVTACRTAGLEGATLVRDESGAALDAEKGRAYVAMLRRAVAMVGASRVLVVSHSPAVIAECDAALRFEDGAARFCAVGEE